MDVLRQPDERHERDRTVTLRWRTGEMVADGYGREGEVIITLDVSHVGYGKRYVASLRRSPVSDGGARATRGGGVQVYSEPCARFSRSGLARAQLAAWDVVHAYQGDHALVCELVALANREPVAA